MIPEFDYTESYIYEVAQVENSLRDLSRILLKFYVPAFDELLDATDGLLASMEKINAAYGSLDEDVAELR